jgi:hypothetical protein
VSPLSQRFAGCGLLLLGARRAALAWAATSVATHVAFVVGVVLPAPCFCVASALIVVLVTLSGVIATLLHDRAAAPARSP